MIASGNFALVRLSQVEKNQVCIEGTSIQQDDSKQLSLMLS